MKIRLKSFVVLSAALLLGGASRLCAGTPSSEGGMSPPGKNLQAAVDQCQQPELRKYLASLKGKADAAKNTTDADAGKSLDMEIESAVKVANDVSASKDKPAGVSGFAYYVVPPISNIKRSARAYPADGALAGPVRIVAAKGEFEPASFVIYPFSDAGKVELTVSDLAGKNGKIPASAVDVKVVKIWYQAGTAWHSYFADSAGRELVPELLLNDENLVKVDTKSKDNYVRVDYPPPRGSEYVWISNPVRIDVPFNDHLEPVRDAKSLRPFSLTAGEFKQIWLTLEAPKTAEGVYSGAVTVTIDGKSQGAIPLEIRVLPFELPDPKTNYDLSREYYTSIYNHCNLGEHLKKNGGDLEKAKHRLYNEYVNMRKHNVMYPMVKEVALGSEKTLSENMEIYKKAGLRTDAIFGAIPALPDYGWMTSPEVKNIPMAKQPMPETLIRKIDVGREIMLKAVGHTNIYCFGWDEPGMGLLVAERKPWKQLQDKGLKTYSTGNNKHLVYGGYNEDFVNNPNYSKETSDKWHAFGARITSYANPHTGPENPDFTRRTHGMDLYKADCDGTNNYILYEGAWNDFIGTEYNFRSFNLIYPCVDAPIDTIQWEGFREGIDDVRYATLLKQLAHKAIDTGKTESVYQGRLALQWLALLDAKTCDLNTARLEMAAYILKLGGFAAAF